MVRAAIRCGVLVRGECSQRDETCDGRIEGHHEDYSQPLVVVWLCRKHHWQLHTERNRMKKQSPPRDLAVVNATGSETKGL